MTMLGAGYEWCRPRAALPEFTPAPSEFTEADLPYLIGLLDDPDSNYEPGGICAELMKMKGNVECVRAVKRYLERKEKYDSYLIRLRKSTALQTIGYIGGPEASAVLRQVFTEEGARELMKTWLNDPVPEDARVAADSRLWIISNFQSQAAQGLAHTGDPEDMALVEKEYRRIAGLRMRDERYYRPWAEVESSFTDEERRRDFLFTGLVSAMAEHAAAVDLGRPVPFIDPESNFHLVEPYIWKYLVPQPPE